MDSLKPRIIEGEGTPEASWQHWLAGKGFPQFAASQMLSECQRMVIVAPHPDDEVLGAAGFIQLSARNSLPCTIVSVTDGEASHPNSLLWTQEELRLKRIQESTRAQRFLAPKSQFLRLKIPDGKLVEHRSELLAALETILKPFDAVFCTWRYDGHPDHDVTGQICVELCQKIGSKCFEIPIWAWHWASPSDPRIPWNRAVVLPLTSEQLALKQQALACFQSQLIPDPTTGKDAILPSWAVRRLMRPFELVFT